MKLIKAHKILILALMAIIIFSVAIAYAKASNQTTTNEKPWVECRKSYRQALKDEYKVYVTTVKTANANYRQALKETEGIGDRIERRQFLQKARLDSKETKKSALTAIKANKKLLKAKVKACEAENK